MFLCPVPSSLPVSGGWGRGVQVQDSKSGEPGAQGTGGKKKA